jgi:Flp pilus assembly protein TadB
MTKENIKKRRNKSKTMQAEDNNILLLAETKKSEKKVHTAKTERERKKENEHREDNKTSEKKDTSKLTEEIKKDHEDGTEQKNKQETKQKSKAEIEIEEYDAFTKSFATKKHNAKERHFLKNALKKAGHNNIDDRILKNKIFSIIILLLSALSVITIAYGLIQYSILNTFIILAALWLLGWPLITLMTWLLIYLFLDYKKYKRRTELEEVWAEYLQLVVANISAGMLIDVALWSAVKPKFKVLSKEIEEVAKQTLTGVDLTTALKDFSEKYDSPMLKRTINILIEGMNSGGKIATLLNKIAIDIEETRIMKKEAAASLMTYSIFITFAAIVAAPILFGLSAVLLTILQQIIGNVAKTGGTVSFISLGTDTVNIKDFKTFVYIMLITTSTMSAFIVGTIHRGRIKEGLRYVPAFIIVSIIMYLMTYSILSRIMGSMI